MAGARHPRTSLLALLAVLLLAPLAAACGGDGDDTPTTTLAPPTTLPAMPTDFSWWDPSPTPIGQGWVLTRCTDPHPELDRQSPGQASGVVCLEHPDGRRGLVRLYRDDTTAETDLDAYAAHVVETITTDRKQGCGKGYEVASEPVDLLKLPEGPTRRYGFTGGSTGSVTTERTVQWAGLRGTALEIITVAAFDPGSCIVPQGDATLASQLQIVPGIEALIVASGFEGPKPG